MKVSEKISLLKQLSSGTVLRAGLFYNILGEYGCMSSIDIGMYDS